MPRPEGDLTRPEYDIWIDQGGTFTDCIGWDRRTGRLRVVKVLSSARATLEGIGRLREMADGAVALPLAVRMGTTVATNALLERKGVPTGLLITEGFADLLSIGNQTRPDLFALDIVKPPSLHCASVEIDARQSPDGRIVDEPEAAALTAEIRAMVADGVESVAVAVLFGHRDGRLERRVAEVARAAGVAHVTCSHEVAVEEGFVARSDTAVADAYLTPLLRRYVDNIADELPDCRLRLMQSSGGLVAASRFRGKDAVLSGPAGGVVAAGQVALQCGHQQVIGFDMGGTSTDVSRWHGAPERTYETVVAGVRLRTPMLAIHTVAAGGGSVCRYDGHRLTVGPDSAGARPGPLCYGDANANELTLTDVNLFLGRIVRQRFPLPLVREPVDLALAKLSADMARDGFDRSPIEIAEGFHRIADEAMAEAIRRITVARGHDPRDHALVVFGGAGGQHGCGVARRLGIRTLLFHPLAGVLSAFGIGVAQTNHHGAADLGSRLVDDGLAAAVENAYLDLEHAAAADLWAQEGRSPTSVRRIDLRYRGTHRPLTVAYADGVDLIERFEAEHELLFGYLRPGHPIEATTIRVEATVERDPVDLAAMGASFAAGRASAAYGSTIDPLAANGEMGRLVVDAAIHECPILAREELVPGTRLPGPIVVVEDTGTIICDRGFELCLREDGIIVLEDVQPVVGKSPASIERDPVLTELFSHRFTAVAEQMGIVLRRTALSTNIRERLDFSCAVFDASGELIANAPHIPVHLGSMGDSVKAVMARHGSPRRGDVFATNDPAEGGTHLPDITVVSPLHDDEGLVFAWVASRGHHADVGGTAPGSMPADATQLSEEGVVIRCLPLVRDGRFDEPSVRKCFARGAYPARAPADNLADIEAQIAANRCGEALMAAQLSRHGRQVLDAQMGHVRDAAAGLVGDAIEGIADGVYRFADCLDDGTAICTAIHVDGRKMLVDFAGTGGPTNNNSNAPPAVTKAALLYVLRCLVAAPIPLNGGCLRDVDLRIPKPSVLAPPPTAAVAAGNVETSQRVVDVLLGALGLAAASQGTMNNVSFGSDDFGYYETLGGGAGATPTAPGASGVHTHMTNSRITDPEVLEARYPVRLRRFALRPGSGGEGRHRGGDGLIREYEFLAPMEVSLLSERRQTRPFGLAGGRPGQAGVNSRNGRVISGRARFAVGPGDRLCIETPGGGGYGEP